MGRTVSIVDPVTYTEETASHRVQGVPLSHLSIEVGHFYMEDLSDGIEPIRDQFRRTAPWVAAARASVKSGTKPPRVSTCFLLDDYFHTDPDPTPQDVITKVRQAAEECGVPIDYMVREAACRKTDDVELARLTAARLLHEPAPGTNGSRPPAQQSGWLCNGQRSPSTEPAQAMRAESWKPPVQFGMRQHSIFIDVEMWKDNEDRVNGERVTQRLWSCPFLAAIWHLMRLGMVRGENGEQIAEPQPPPDDDNWPEHWDELPTVMRLNPKAQPFAAYRTASVLPRIYLPIEHASGVILDHLRWDDTVTETIIERAKKEGITVPRRLTERMSHHFVEGS